MTDPNQQPPPIQLKRVLPQNELDLQMLTLNSVWGMPEVSPELKQRLSEWYVTRNDDGTEEIRQIEYWGLLSYYTRDLRLANLNPLTGEYQTAQHYLNLAGDLLQSGMYKPFLIALSRVATLCELSQSKSGFVRRKLNTFTQEHIQRNEEPPKKSLFGKPKNREDM